MAQEPSQDRSATALSVGAVARFWAPLAATWLMMATEGPFVAAIIARLPDPEHNLAAYGVALSLAMIIEAPVIMMMSASTALVADRASLIAVRRFAYGLNILVTAVMGLLVLRPVFFGLTRGLIGLPAEVAQLTAVATMLLLPWPAAIGYRRFYQGILIRHGLTRRVAYGTLTRVGTMATTAVLLALTTQLPGAAVGGAALAAGVVVEAIASRIMARTVVRNVLADPRETVAPLSTATILRFYYPLALTSFLILVVNPLVTFFMGHSPRPLESLAVLPVLGGIVFAFRSPGVAYQEVGIALLGDDRRGLPVLRRFAVLLGVITSGALVVLAATPLAGLWLRGAAGLSASLASFAAIPLLILAPMPALEVALSFQRSLFVHARRTHPITLATSIEVVGVIGALTVTIGVLHAPGALAAAVSLLLGRLAANLYLAAAARRQL
jgi:hypothetical protein